METGKGSAQNGTTTLTDVLSMGQVADLIGCQTWKIRRLIGRGLLPEPVRIGVVPIFHRDQLPAIRERLREAGYLPGSPGGNGEKKAEKQDDPGW
jgi:hypothetical protein